MAFTSPRTWVAGEVATAANFNTHLRDNVAWIATDSPACRAYNNANLAITTGTTTAVTLNSERFDNATVHSTSSNTSRFAIPSGAGGKYIMVGSIKWANDTGGEFRQMFWRANGATILVDDTRGQTAVSGHARNQAATVYALNAADYVEMTAGHDKGSNLNIEVQGNYSPEGAVFWFRT